MKEQLTAGIYDKHETKILDELGYDFPENAARQECTCTISYIFKSMRAQKRYSGSPSLTQGINSHN